MHRRLGAARSAAVAAALALAACTWVSLSEAGGEVKVLSAAEVTGCQKVGHVSAKTADRVLIFARDERTIEKELRSLARNEAAGMRGNAIVPTGDPMHGRQTFDVYRCAR